MESEEWNRIESLFHAALERENAERDAFLANECGDDPEMLEEVRQLLDLLEVDPEYLSDAAVELGLALIGEEEPDPLIGVTIDEYKIIERLGSGGMGDVYLAEDTQLHRKAALKFLNPALVGDERAKAHLESEARSVAKIDHKNVCQIYAIRSFQGNTFLAIQYVEGESLAKMLKQGPIEPKLIEDLSLQIVEAIAAAHSRRIIHRDIKPGNMMVTPSGVVKVLDFGLAKAIFDATVDSVGVMAGENASIAIGTPGYMAPEQARREKAVYASDVYSIGAVIYEMATGENPFRDRESAALDPDELDWSMVPARLRPIIRKCLSPKIEDRYQSAHTLLNDLKPQLTIAKKSLPLRRPVLSTVFVFLVAFTTFSFLKPYEVSQVAVLPFANETNRTEYDYLADGLAEDLSQRISEIEGFQSVPYSKLIGASQEGPNSEAAVGARPRAELTLMGRIYTDDRGMRLQTKLIDASGGEVRNKEFPIWPDGDMAATQKAVIDSMFGNLQLNGLVLKAEARGGTTNPEAFRLYMVGRHCWRKRDPENLQKAIAAFDQAINLDPTFSKAHAVLANSYILLNSVAYDGSLPPQEAFSRARAAAREALRLDGLNAEAHTSLGVVLTKHDWNWEEAERSFRRAIELDPNDGGAHYWFSGLLGITGRATESIEKAEKAKELDPFSPLVELNLARTYYFAREYDKSLEVLDRQTITEANETKILYLKGLNMLQKGSLDHAVKVFAQVTERKRMLGIAALGFTLAKAGRRAEAERIVKELEAESNGHYVPPQEIAIIYIGLGEKDKAFEKLDRAFKEKYGSFSAIKVEPLFDSIRDDVRFADLLRRMRLAEI